MPRISSFKPYQEKILLKLEETPHKSCSEIAKKTAAYAMYNRKERVPASGQDTLASAIKNMLFSLTNKENLKAASLQESRELAAQRPLSQKFKTSLADFPGLVKLANKP